MNLLTGASLLALAKSIYYFSLKTFSSKVQVFVTSVSDSLNLILIFAYLNKLDRSPFQQSRFNTHLFQLQKIWLFLRLFALKCPLFSLQMLIRCGHKQTVWH